jgi:ABC-type transporter Mla subunit MlaD
MTREPISFEESERQIRRNRRLSILVALVGWLVVLAMVVWMATNAA